MSNKPCLQCHGLWADPFWHQCPDPPYVGAAGVAQCPGCLAGTLDGHIYGHGEQGRPQDAHSAKSEAVSTEPAPVAIPPRQEPDSRAGRPDLERIRQDLTGLTTPSLRPLWPVEIRSDQYAIANLARQHLDQVIAYALSLEQELARLRAGLAEARELLTDYSHCEIYQFVRNSPNPGLRCRYCGEADRGGHALDCLYERTEALLAAAP